MTQEARKKPRAVAPAVGGPVHRDIGIAAVAAAVRYQGLAQGRATTRDTAPLPAARETLLPAGR